MLLSGTVGGEEIDDPDTRQYISPFSIIVGADFEWALSDGWLVRVPLDIGIAVDQTF